MLTILWGWLGLPQIALFVAVAVVAVPAFWQRRKAERAALDANLGDLTDAFLLEVEVGLRAPDDTRNPEDLRRVARLQRPLRRRLSRAWWRFRAALYVTLTINTLVIGLPWPLIFSGLDDVLMVLALLGAVTMLLFRVHVTWLERQIRRELNEASEEARALYRATGRPAPPPGKARPTQRSSQTTHTTRRRHL